MPPVNEMVIEVDGLSINQYAWNIQGASWRHRMSPKRGRNDLVPYREGRIFQPKMYDQRTLVLPMWVIGANGDGTLPVSGNRKVKMLKNVQMLKRAFATNQALRNMRIWDPVNNKYLEGQFETNDQIDFTMNPNATKAAFIVTITMPYVWFRDIAYLFDVATPTVRAHSSQWNLTTDSDVEIKDSIVIMKGRSGGVVNPRVSNVSLGDHEIKYNATLNNNEVLTVDVGSFTADLDGGDVTPKMTWIGGRREMLVLRNGPNTMKFRSQGGNSADIQIKWKGAYW